MLQKQTPLLELDLLKTVVAIAETGNFSSAAEATFRTPSAISMQVKKMEELLGKPVFVRDSRSVSLTPDGEQLLTHARRVLSLNSEIISKFITPDVEGEVSVGAADDVAERFLGGFLRAFAETHPYITINVVVDNSRAMIHQIEQNKLDIALVTCDLGATAQSGAECLFRERLVWAGLKGGIAFEKEPLPISVWEEGCAWRNAGLTSLEEQNRRYRIAFKSAHLSGQKAAILSDLAIAPIPISVCTGPIEVLGSQHNLPAITDYELGMVIVDDANAAVLSAADHLRASFLKQSG